MTSILTPDATSWSNGRECPCPGHAEQYGSIRAYQAHRAKKLAQHQVQLGPRAKNSPHTRPIWALARKYSPSTRSNWALARKYSPSTPSTATFRPFFPRWANFFAFAFTSDRTGRTFSRPEHRDVITVKPTASLNARPSTKLSQHAALHALSGTKLSQQPPSHTLGGTKLSQHAALHALSGTKLSQRAKKRLFLPKMPQQGEFCTARRVQKPSRENFVPAIASSRLHHR